MHNRRLSAAALVTVAVLTGAVACGSSQAQTKKGTSAAAVQVRITPGDGTGKARPDQGVVVQASGGKLDQVNVQVDGRQVPGDFSPDRASWKTKWTLSPGASYSVSASAKSRHGKATTATSKFTTAKAGQRIGVADIVPSADEKVGVGMPIIVKFDRPVANRAQVEQALEVRSDKGDIGAWRWDNDQQVVFRTEKYWQPHQRVTVTAHLAGVRAAKNVYGTKDVSRNFQIGASNITVASSKTHYMKVNHDGVIKKFPISMGVGTTTEYTTTSGVHITQEKSPLVTMESPGRKKGDPGYYKEDVSWAVRITNRGEYVHQSVGEYGFLGKQNASHGCVRTSPKGARYFFKISQRGDIVNVTGTKRKLVNEQQSNGWTYWTLSWPKWLKGSALPH